MGLCSYLLIGFYYSNRNNGNAALKAFIVTRVGDVFMAFGLFILFQQFGTLNIQELLVLAPQKFPEDVYKRQGINSYYLTSDGSTMSYRTRIRTPSFAHLQQIPSVINGSMIADLIAYLGSIDFVMADVDR